MTATAQFALSRDNDSSDVKYESTPALNSHSDATEYLTTRRGRFQAKK